ncbi:hypothetical protein GCM10011609_73900 [Lentzea pudingi]|uniref:Uncharacterized protein n=1 Tax=Lentzea pudingi TaxID=1789439 RepID=A0ABQ2IRT5_9PSEU|nr:hypothetical protein GCM10011609_73900 [Lentzea pudingi]
MPDCWIKFAKVRPAGPAPTTVTERFNWDSPSPRPAVLRCSPQVVDWNLLVSVNWGLLEQRHYSEWLTVAIIPRNDDTAPTGECSR